MTDFDRLSRVRRVDHVAIVVHSVDIAMEFYTNVLGLALSHDEILTDAGVRLAYLTPDVDVPAISPSCCVQLVEPLGSGPIADFLAARGEGLHHVCFVVADMARALTDFGDQLAQPFLGGRGTKVCFLTQRHHGCIIEVAEEPVPPEQMPLKRQRPVSSRPPTS